MPFLMVRNDITKMTTVALSAISDFLMEQDMLVYMVLYNRESLAVSRKLFHSIEEYIDDNYVEGNNENLDETFSEMLLRLIDERSLKDSYVYKKANVDHRHFSKIKNDIEYASNKKTVIAFAIALELTLDEAVDLMGKAGFAFQEVLNLMLLFGG